MSKFTKHKNIIFIIGLTFLGLSVTLIQQTNLGMSAWDALNRNFYEGIPLDYRYLNPIVALVLISFAYLLQKRKASLWMLFPLIISFYVGIIIDVFILIIPSVASLSLLWNIIYLALALFICAVGLNLILFCDYPLPALDELCNGFAKRFHISFGQGKLIGELIAIILTVIVGYLFSFQDEFFFIGPTTLIFGLMIGLIVDLLKKPIQSFLVRFDK